MHVNETSVDSLSRADCQWVITIVSECYRCENESQLHQLIMKFAGYLAVEYVLVCYLESDYRRQQYVHVVNLSNPVPWMDEYAQKKYVVSDPVRNEIERRITAKGSRFIEWDTYDVPLSAIEKEIIVRRNKYGLHYGCSTFDSSSNNDSTLVLSLASEKPLAMARLEAFTLLIIPHLNRARKRIGILLRVHCLSKRERVVADWICKGKTNWEISQILAIKEGTVKFHVTNVFKKLQVSNRCEAMSVLMAVRYLSL